jgi:hypothetical protein
VKLVKKEQMELNMKLLQLKYKSSHSYRAKQDYKLDLLDEYQNPVPFPKDKFIELGLPSNQYYVMFSSVMTGN